MKKLLDEVGLNSNCQVGLKGKRRRVCIALLSLIWRHNSDKHSLERYKEKAEERELKGERRRSNKREV